MLSYERLSDVLFFLHAELLNSLFDLVRVQTILYLLASFGVLGGTCVCRKHTGSHERVSIMRDM